MNAPFTDMSRDPIVVPTNASSSETSTCCAQFYEQDWVRKLLGDNFHPGGAPLTARLIDSLRLPRSARVLDIACGTGTTALDLVKTRQFNVVGFDFSAKNVERARQRATEVNLAAPKLSFVEGDAATLPFDDASFDAVICECAVSTFADKPTVIAEFARVLRAGGVVGISDMAVYGDLPEDITSLVAPWTCVADARTVEGYQSLFLDQALRCVSYVDESGALHEMAIDLKRKLVLAGLGQMTGGLGGLDLNVDQIREMLTRARELVDAQIVQYCRLVFSKGAPRFADIGVDMDVDLKINPSKPAPVQPNRRSLPICQPGSGCC